MAELSNRSSSESAITAPRPVAHGTGFPHARAAGLDEKVRRSEEAGLYDLPNDPPFERLPMDDTE